MNLTTIGGQAATMTSIDLRDIINEARAAANEPRVRNDQFIARVQDELGDELGGPMHARRHAGVQGGAPQCSGEAEGSACADDPG